MSDNQSGRAIDAVELVLSLLAVIAGSVAATGAFLGASYEKHRVDLESKPAILLACHQEFRALDVAEGTKPPILTALLASDGAHWVHIVGDGRGDTPQPFATCALTNYGQLPVFNIRIALMLRSSNGSTTTRTHLDFPGLSPSTPYSFALTNGTTGEISFVFDPTLTLMRVDTGEQNTAALFLDGGLIDLQQRAIRPESRKSADTKTLGSPESTTVDIRDFAYGPNPIHVRTNTTVAFVNHDSEAHTVTSLGDGFDSGAIDSGGIWRHRFLHQGTYRYTCRFHPYMRGQIIVSR